MKSSLEKYLCFDCFFKAESDFFALELCDQRLGFLNFSASVSR